MCSYFRTCFVGIRRHWILAQFHMPIAQLARAIDLSSVFTLDFLLCLFYMFFLN